MTTVDVTPSASRLTGSLRDIGYDLNTAMADLVDNSIEAGASTIDIQLCFDGLDSRIVVADDGEGMTGGALDEALRFGTRRTYGRNDLGRYGLGLKTAAISQGRRLTVVTRSAPKIRRLYARRLDLDHIARTDRWEITTPGTRERDALLGEALDTGPGTVVVIDRLDRVLPARNPEGGWARRRFATLAARLRQHLGMVFHRFLEGEEGQGLTIVVNGEKVRAWDPFARQEEHTQVLPTKVLRLDGAGRAPVKLTPYVLPPRRRFSTPEAFERAAGPERWNRQQGLYIYRAGRLIQSGGWSGLRAADEHTKLARVALDFDTDADEAFRINVAKMRVSLPQELKSMLERPVQEVCNAANAAYRVDARATRRSREDDGATRGSAREVGTAMLAAASRCGHTDALLAILRQLQADNPDMAAALGWG